MAASPAVLDGPGRQGLTRPSTLNDFQNPLGGAPVRRDWEQVTRRVRPKDIVRNLSAALPSWDGKSPPVPRPSMADLRPTSSRFRPQGGLQVARLRTRCNSLPHRRHLVWRRRARPRPSSSPQAEASPAPVRRDCDHPDMRHTCGVTPQGPLPTLAEDLEPGEAILAFGSARWRENPYRSRHKRLRECYV